MGLGFSVANSVTGQDRPNDRAERVQVAKLTSEYDTVRVDIGD